MSDPGSHSGGSRRVGAGAQRAGRGANRVGAGAERVATGAERVARVWRQLPHERKLAAGAAIALFVTLFLPWYQDTVILSGSGKAAGPKLISASITGWGAFSFVEAAVLLVAASVLMLLFIRGEGRAFHVPGGDGSVITVGGVWTCLLILWRIFDKASGQDNHGQYLTSTGIEWGIFVALAVAGSLAYAGSRLRLARESEPPLPGEPRSPRRRARASTTDEAPRRLVSAEAERPPQMHSDQGRRASRGLGLPDLDEIEFEDPPTARLSRPRPASPRGPRSAQDDDLTTPIDHRWD